MTVPMLSLLDGKYSTKLRRFSELVLSRATYNAICRTLGVTAARITFSILFVVDSQGYTF